MDISDSLSRSFAETYQVARRLFLDAVDQEHLRATSISYPQTGPEGESLKCDIAWAGRSNAARVLVLVSATHGIEGFCGSGCQVDWLRSGQVAALPDGIGVLLVHAINPHGFAWLRRVTEEGCDLNRNFLDFSAPLPENPGHDDLVDCFVPSDLDSKTLKIAEARIAAYRERHGERAFQTARKAGQYRHPHSMFFGGFAPSRARLALESIIDSCALASREQVAVIDFHTGLGPFGYGEPISGHRPGTPGFAWVNAAFGESVGVPELGTSSSIPLHGTARDVWDRHLGEHYGYLALEFGTYSQERGRVALRDDHWLHRRRNIDWHADETRRIKRAIKKHYYPGSLDWKEMVLWRSRQVIRQAIVALNGG